MRESRILMGMPVTVCVAGDQHGAAGEAAFAYLESVDRRFSPCRPDSEVGLINAGRLGERDYSDAMREVLALAERTRRETRGYFNARRPDGRLDPSGIVKGWAIRNAAAVIAGCGQRDYFVDAGGDIESAGRNEQGEPWRVGIRNPFAPDEIVKVVYPRGKGVATSGTYARGQHIYNPHAGGSLEDLVSLTVVADDVLEADRFATAAFAMGSAGMEFIEALPGLEAYAVTPARRAILTSGFDALCTP